MKQSMQQLLIFKALLVREVHVFLKLMPHMIIDSLIWPLTHALVSGYIFPMMGVLESYSSFLFVGVIVGSWVWLMFSLALLFVQNLETTKLIESELILPVAPQLVVMKHACSLAFTTFMANVPIILVGRFVLKYRFNITIFSWLKFICIKAESILMLSFLAVFIAGFSTTESFVRVRTRLLDPLFFLGGYMTSWASMHKIFPLLSSLMLCNPFTYVTEGTRSALFGPAGYLSYWLCVSVIGVYTIFFALLALNSVHKRLDYVP